MKVRNDLPCLVISNSSFLAFEKDQEVEEKVPEEWDLQPKDQIKWQYARLFYGKAEVLKRQGEVCTIKKISYAPQKIMSSNNL